MARYKVTATSFIDGILYQPGDEVEYAGDRIGPNLKYLSGKKPKEVYDSAEITVDPDVDLTPNAKQASNAAADNASSSNATSNSSTSSANSDSSSSRSSSN